MGESVSLPPTPPPARLVDKSNSLMESDELKRRAALAKTKEEEQQQEQEQTVKSYFVPRISPLQFKASVPYCLVRWEQRAGLGKGTGLTLCGDVKATDSCSVCRPATQR